jgi:hypothetical protein
MLSSLMQDRILYAIRLIPQTQWKRSNASEPKLRTRPEAGGAVRCAIHHGDHS